LIVAQRRAGRIHRHLAQQPLTEILGTAPMVLLWYAVMRLAPKAR